MTETDASASERNRMDRVAGFCPMGCGETLFLALGGAVTCSYVECPRPTAVDDLLEDSETEHVLQLDEDDFTIRHPLRERLDDALMECDLHHYLTSLDGPPRLPGRYRASKRQGQWLFIAAADRGSNGHD